MKSYVFMHKGETGATVEFRTTQFNIDVSTDKNWLTDLTRISPVSGRYDTGIIDTVGKLNREHLHKMLDEFIADYIRTPTQA